MLVKELVALSTQQDEITYALLGQPLIGSVVSVKRLLIGITKLTTTGCELIENSSPTVPFWLLQVFRIGQSP
jgi:hypothetical protein